MTTEEFEKTGFTNGMTCIYCNQVHKIISVNFQENLLGLREDNDEDCLFWVRCESVSEVQYSTNMYGYANN